MPGLQWLGTIPRENSWSYLANALKGGLEGYISGREKAADIQSKLLDTALQVGKYNLEKEKVEVSREKLAQDLKKVDTQTKLNLVKTLNQMAKVLTPDARLALSQSPEVRELYKQVYGNESVVDQVIGGIGEIGSTPTITQQDLKALRADIPLWDRLVPGDWTEQAKVYKKAKEARKTQAKQKVSKVLGSKGSVFVGVNKRKSAEQRFKELMDIYGGDENKVYEQMVKEGY